MRRHGNQLLGERGLEMAMRWERGGGWIEDVKSHRLFYCSLGLSVEHIPRKSLMSAKLRRGNKIGMWGLITVAVLVLWVRMVLEVG